MTTIHVKDAPDNKREVRALKKTKFLVIHASVDFEGFFDISHIPTGYRVVSCDSLAHAKEFLKAIEGFDWNFKTPLDKPAGLNEQMSDAYKNFKQKNGYHSARMR